MSYYLTFQGKTVFCAFEDTPESEQKLSTFVRNSPSWDDLLSSTELTQHIVEGDPVLGVRFKVGSTFVSTDTGFPQIDFEGNPQHLLFIYGSYSVSSTDDIIFRGINPGIIRVKNSTDSYTPSEQNVIGLQSQIDALASTQVSPATISELQKRVSTLSSAIDKVMAEGSLTSSILDYISNEEKTRITSDALILEDIENIEKSIQNKLEFNSTGILDITRYPTKSELERKLEDYSTKSYLSGYISNKTDETDFAVHKNDNKNPHEVNPIQIGAVSLSQLDVVLEELNILRSKFNSLVEQLNQGEPLVLDAGSLDDKMDISGGQFTGEVRVQTPIDPSSPVTKEMWDTLPDTLDEDQIVNLINTKTDESFVTNSIQAFKSEMLSTYVKTTNGKIENDVIPSQVFNDEKTFSKFGPIAVGVGQGIWMPSEDGYFRKIKAFIEVPPSGSDVVIDVTRNGDSIFAGSDRLRIPSGSNQATFTLSHTPTFSEDDVVRIKLDQVGSSVVGSNLTVQVNYRYNPGE